MPTGANDVLMKNVLYLAKEKRRDLEFEIREEVSYTHLDHISFACIPFTGQQVKDLLANKYGSIKDDAERLRCIVKDKDVDEAVHAEAGAITTLVS